MERHNTLSTLDYLGWALQETGYQTDLIAPDTHPEHPYPQLLVMLDPEVIGTEAVVRLFLAEDLLPEQTEAKGIQTLRLFLNWPLPRPQPAQMAELAHLVGVLNRLLPLGTLSCNAAEGVVFQDSQPGTEASVSPPLVVEMLELLSDLVARWRPPLRAFLDGAQSFSATRDALVSPSGASRHV